MRQLYIDIVRVLAAHARLGNRMEIGQILININSENSPNRDQEITDLLSEFYIFVIFGYDQQSYPGGIRDWEELDRRIEALQASSRSPGV